MNWIGLSNYLKNNTIPKDITSESVKDISTKIENMVNNIKYNCIIAENWNFKEALFVDAILENYTNYKDLIYKLNKILNMYHIETHKK